jgi:hypothetical protein
MHALTANEISIFIDTDTQLRYHRKMVIHLKIKGLDRQLHFVTNRKDVFSRKLSVAKLLVDASGSLQCPHASACADIRKITAKRPVQA